MNSSNKISNLNKTFKINDNENKIDHHYDSIS